MPFPILISLIFILGCHNPEKPEDHWNDPETKAQIKAIERLAMLQQKNLLPEMKPGDEWENAETHGFEKDRNKTNSFLYVTIRVEKRGDTNWFYDYTLKKSSPKGDWSFSDWCKIDRSSGTSVPLK